MATEPRNPQFIYIYDTSIRVFADSKEEADEKLADLEATIEHCGSYLTVFDAYGTEDAETGEELRPVE